MSYAQHRSLGASIFLTSATKCILSDLVHSTSSDDFLITGSINKMYLYIWYFRA